MFNVQMAGEVPMIQRDVEQLARLEVADKTRGEHGPNEGRGAGRKPARLRKEVSCIIEGQGAAVHRPLVGV